MVRPVRRHPVKEVDVAIGRGIAMGRQHAGDQSPFGNFVQRHAVQLLVEYRLGLGERCAQQAGCKQQRK